MEQIVTTSVCFLMILAIVRVGSVPAPSDIISGREFLSILMKPTAETSPSSGAANGGGAAAPARNFRGLRKFRHFYLDQSGTNDDTILPIEVLFTSQEDLDRSSTRFYGYRRGGQRASSNGGSTTTSSTTPSTTTVEEEALVNGVDPGITTTSSPPPPSWHVDGEPTTPPMEANGGTAGESAELTTLDDASTTTVPPLEEEEDQTTAALPSVVVTRSPGARYAKRAKAIQQPVESTAHHSHAHRTELSVEELSPTISKEEEPVPLDDSAKGESSAVAKLIAPPAGSPQRYRTQRKQESAGGQPFQTVRYHDRKPTTGDVGTLAWRDNDGDQKAPLKPAMREKSSIGSAPMYSEPARFYSEPAQYYSEPAKVYSEPARIYGEPEKVYSEPARVYSEPAKVYSEPARIYSEPAKVYSEPAKIYSQPSSYWQTVYSARPADPTTTTAAPTTTPTTTTTTTAEPAASTEPSTAPVRLVFNELDKIPYDQLNAPTVDGEDAGSSIHSAIGKFVPKQSHGQGAGEEDSRQVLGVQQQQQQQPAVVVQTLAPGVLGPGDDSKVGYVVEGRNYRKYRVEEKTPDGFIVGEYGVLSHNDGNLRGVRYTADSDINPRLIYDALLKFLSL